MASTDPKTATQGQWEDLASRVKAKSDVDITMTNVDPGEGATLAADHYIGVYGGDPIITDYSTNEINTGAKWINGEPIYKKTIYFGALPNSSEKTINHNISNISFVAKYECVAFKNDMTTLMIPFSGTSSTQDIYAIVDDTSVTLGDGMDRTAYNAYITIYYTKSS